MTSRVTRNEKRSLRLHSALSNAGLTLQALAERMSWIFSRKNYLEFTQYEELKRRAFLKKQRQYLDYLKRRKLIEIKTIGHRLKIRLTDTGWAQALRDKIKTTATICKNGQCFLMFDIPEKERRTRNMLRNFLKESGFVRLQHSVWMTNRDVVKPLKELLQRQKLEKWICIIVGDIITSALDKLFFTNISKKQ